VRRSCIGGEDVMDSAKLAGVVTAKVLLQQSYFASSNNPDVHAALFSQSTKLLVMQFSFSS